MSDLIYLLVFLTLLAAGFIFWKLSQIKWRNRSIIPLKYRIAASIIILLLIPAILFLGLAIAIIIAIFLLIGLLTFLTSWLRLRK